MGESSQRAMRASSKRPLRRVGEPARVAFAACVLVLLVGCANRPPEGPTGYVSMGSSAGAGYGYMDKSLGDDEFSVVVAGNRYTTPERVGEIALLRAARIAQEQGRSHFVVLNRKAGTYTMHQSQTIAVPVVQAGIPRYLAYLPVGENTRREPTVTVLIRLLPLQGANPPDAVDAGGVIERLKKRFE